MKRARSSAKKQTGRKPQPKQKKSATRKKSSVPETPAKAKKTGLSGRSTSAKAKDDNIKHFPVAGVGASAGGIEAFSKLLQHLPPDLGMAYVFIQHLSPTHESYLPEILEKKTKMPVLKAENNMKVRKDHVYVIPPSYNIIIMDGTLKLLERSSGENFHPIDYFLKSLAAAYHENAIGIILSGTAHDGTLGLKAIKAEGGITFAQDDTASFLSMPHHAVDMGYVDFVLSPDKIAKELISLMQQPFTQLVNQENFFDKNKNDLRRIHMIMHSKRNVDFSYYKQSTIHRRITRRMLLNRKNDLSEYIQLLKENNAEVDALYQDLLITVTDFFRDPGIEQALMNKVLPAIFKNRNNGDALRVWIPGCATGEEAVSIAIIIFEYLGDEAFNIPVQIFATDLNEKAIDRARSGIYSKGALQKVTPVRIKRFFKRAEGGYQVIKAIRDVCIFAPHNLLKDPPFSRIDIISCQNVLIYLEGSSQNKIMHSFHYGLKQSGFLILGKSETIGVATDLFEHLGKEYKIYTKKAITTPLHFDYSAKNYTDNSYLPEREEKGIGEDKEIDLEKVSEKLLLSRYVPASVLVNKDLEILRFRGHTSRYLEPASGKASLHLMKMVKDEIAFELRTLLHLAKKEGQAVKKEGLQIGVDGNIKDISLEAIPINGNGKELYYLIVFQEDYSAPLKAGPKPQIKLTRGQKEKKIQVLETQLQEAREGIKNMNEEFEATREELQSANEEVLSSNEELQSINEELETSKEELQSTNEELTTINEELNNRNAQLKEVSEYAQATIETMHESLIMLYSDLRIKSANKGFYSTFQVSPEDTEGFYLFDIGNRQWDIPELRKKLKLVLSRNIQFANFEVEHVFPDIGRKTMLLNAQKFLIKDGQDVLILLAIQDITQIKLAEERMRENQEWLKLLLENAYDIITIFDPKGLINYESPAVESILGYTQEERIGKNIFLDSIVHPEDKHIKEKMLKKAIENPSENIRAEFRMLHKNGSYKTIDAICRNRINDGRINGIVATYRDVTDRKMLEMQKDEFIAIASHELKTPVTSIKAYTQILQDVFEQVNDKKSAGMLEKLNGQVDKLTHLIVDLLDFTRIEGGKFQYKEEKFDLNKMIKEVVEEMQRITSQHTIEMKLDKTAKIWGDRERTGQVLTNLLSNAIKYSPGKKKIIVSSKLEEGMANICVKDFGIGIEKSNLNKVFERFFRVSEPALSTFPGLGLGLYISSEIVKRQGGKIWVRSEKGKGSTFCFSHSLKK